MNFKSLAAIICGAVLLVSTTCFAAVDGGKISLGAVAPGMSEAALVNIFGQPQRKDGEDWIYSNFKVEVERGIVTEVSARNEMIITPDGVRVGLAAEILNSTFGAADKVDSEHDGVEYEYYSTDGTKKIEFKVVNGVIAKITCSLRD